MKNVSFLKMVPLALAIGFANPGQSEDPAALSRILFGSCLKESEASPIFETILAHKPGLFLFLGDNIYADTSDMAVMQAKYDVLAATPKFAELMKTCPVHATWDDHDYGFNDAGADYEKRDEAQKIFVDFWGDAPDSPRRTRPGIYEAKIYGAEGTRVQVIMLDTRYFRGPLKKGEKRVGGVYYPNEDKNVTMLGEAQWAWLEEELKKPAEVRLLVSSIQCVSEASGQETWANLPHERQRLFDLIGKTRANGVVILSGDRHWAELSVAREGVPYPLYDLTSSSFNQIHPRGTPTENRYRESPKTWHRENFGEVAIDWKGENTVVNLLVRDLKGTVVIERAVPLRELRVGEVAGASPDVIPVKRKSDCPDYLRIKVSPSVEHKSSYAIRIEVDSEDAGNSRVSGRLKLASSSDSFYNSSYEKGVHSFNFGLSSRVFEGSEILVTARDGKVLRIDLTSPDFRHR
jgi:alkaline phosphatase D